MRDEHSFVSWLRWKLVAVGGLVLMGCGSSPQQPGGVAIESAAAALSVSLGFDGIGQTTMGTLPDGSQVAVGGPQGGSYADPSFGVGPHHIVQVELGFYQVCTKAGVCQATKSINNLFQNPPFLVGQCYGGLDRAGGSGGNVPTAQVAYDALADRWLFVAPSSDVYESGVCVALSETADPNGPYTRNFFPTPLYPIGRHPGTPHLGVWPDGYYIHFENSLGPNETIYVLPRKKLLTGGFQDAQGFLIPLAGYPRPVNFSGGAAPPAGTPEFIIGNTSEFSGSEQRQKVTGIEVRALHIDWTTPSNSTMTVVGTFPYDQPYAYPGGLINDGNLVPQQDTDAGLGAQNGYGYTPVNYRNMGTFQSIVFSHNVDLAPLGSSTADAAVRWSEIRVTGSTITMPQSANHHPTSNSSWMGSLAIDKAGNIGIVNNESSSSMKPALRVSGRLAADPVNTMTQGNNNVILSSSVITEPHTAFGVWAPEALVPDPDGCTLWLSGNYVLSGTWQSRIASFTLPNCVNLALSKPVTVSSTESANFSGSKAVDGNTATRWSSAFSDPQWIVVDLGSTKTINKVVLRWETAYAKAFQLQTSNDGNHWTTIYTTSTGTGSAQTLNVSGSGHYIRMYGTQRATRYGYSLWEFDVYGDDGTSDAGTGDAGTSDAGTNETQPLKLEVEDGVRSGGLLRNWGMIMDSAQDSVCWDGVDIAGMSQASIHYSNGEGIGDSVNVTFNSVAVGNMATPHCGAWEGNCNTVSTTITPQVGNGTVCLVGQGPGWIAALDWLELH